MAETIFEASRPFGCPLEIIERAADGDLPGHEGHVEIVVEVRAVGGDPWKFPTHTLAHDLDLLDGRARHDSIGHVAASKLCALCEQIDLIASAPGGYAERCRCSTNSSGAERGAGLRQSARTQDPALAQLCCLARLT